MKKQTNKGPRVRATREIKFKDKEGRAVLPLELRAIFGFLPEKIYIQKVSGKNNTIIVYAELTVDEANKEDATLKLKGGAKKNVERVIKQTNE